MHEQFSNTDIYLTSLKKIEVKRLLVSFSSIFGLIWLFLEPASFLVPEKLNYGWSGYLILVCVSLLAAICQNLPTRSISNCLSSPDTEIEIKIGDLFFEKGHLVIGFNDVFDTELGEVIRDSTVQGQFLRRIYSNNQSRLDAEIEAALQAHQTNRQLDPDKNRGRAWRYPIGTAVTLGSYERRYFLLAYGYMNNDLTVASNPDYISTSLDTLWQEVRRKCHGTDVAIPIIGSDLARSGLSRMQLIKLIITSFILESKRRFITRKLTVMIYPKDLDSIDFYALREFLQSACF